MTWSEVVQMSLLQMSFVGGVMILAIIVIRALAVNPVTQKDFFSTLGNSGCAAFAPVLRPLCV